MNRQVPVWGEKKKKKKKKKIHKSSAVNIIIRRWKFANSIKFTAETLATSPLLQRPNTWLWGVFLNSFFQKEGREGE